MILNRELPGSASLSSLLFKEHLARLKFKENAENAIERFISLSSDGIVLKQVTKFEALQPDELP